MGSKVFEIIEKEQERQNNTVELIASENFVSDNIRKALGSVLTNKYTEGYPAERWNDIGRAGRYYGGCQYYDELEEYCCSLWRQVFNTNYHVNVQPHSGSSANMEAYAALLKPGNTILSMSLSAGGHLSHSSSASFVTRFYDVITYGVNKDGFLDYEEVERKIDNWLPNLIVAGASSYPREIDFQRFYNIIQEAKKRNTGYEPYFMVDMAHIAGLIAAGAHQSPFGLADVITTTTQKTLRGPRGGLIFCKPELAKRIDSAVFPRCQGGALQNVIAAKAICAEEAFTPEYKDYIHKVIYNSQAMAGHFKSLDYQLVSGGTDNHMFLLDLTNRNISGKKAQELCDGIGITLNKNAIPFDPLPPSEASGIRIGTAAMTTKGYTAEDFIHVADRIDDIIWNNSNRNFY